MTTTQERSADTEATMAGRDGWAVPGVGVPGADESDGGLDGFDNGSGHPIVVAMLTCLEALGSVRDVSASTLTTREIRLMLLATVQVTAMVFALKLRLLVAGEVQRVMDLTGASSMAAFLAHLTQTERAEASAQVRLAKDLDRRWPLLGQALADGGMDPEQVRVCVAALRKLPRDLDAGQVERCQRALIDAAASMTPRQLRILGRRLWEVVDPDGAEAKEGKDLEDEEELARAKAFFRSWRNGDGTTGFRGKLPDVQADMLIKAIQAFASPRRRSNPNIPTSQPDDTRHDSPSHARRDPDEDDRTDRGNDAAEGPRASGPPGGDPSGPEPCTDDLGDGPDDLAPEDRHTGREIPYPIRLGHGLMDLVERIPEELLPSSGGVGATVVVTMTLEQLLTGLGAATLDTGTPISASQSRRLACEAGLIPVVLGGKSQPLDVGRERRFHSKSQRIALAVRDKACAIDGCDRPAAWCEAHHLVPWEDGGGTNVEGGILACPYHHHLLHNPKWEANWSDGKPRLRRRIVRGP